MPGARKHRANRRRVNGRVVRDGTNDLEFVDLPGDARKEFAQLNGGNRRRDRVKLAPILRRRFGLHVPQIDLRDTAIKENLDAAFGPTETAIAWRGRRERSSGDTPRTDERRS